MNGILRPAKFLIDGDEESIPHVGIWEDDDYWYVTSVTKLMRMGYGMVTVPTLISIS